MLHQGDRFIVDRKICVVVLGIQGDTVELRVDGVGGYSVRHLRVVHPGAIVPGGQAKSAQPDQVRQQRQAHSQQQNGYDHQRKQPSSPSGKPVANGNGGMAAKAAHPASGSNSNGQAELDGLIHVAADSRQQRIGLNHPMPTQLTKPPHQNGHKQHKPQPVPYGRPLENGNSRSVEKATGNGKQKPR